MSLLHYNQCQVSSFTCRYVIAYKGYDYIGTDMIGLQINYCYSYYYIIMDSGDCTFTWTFALSYGIENNSSADLPYPSPLIKIVDMQHTKYISSWWQFPSSLIPLFHKRLPSLCKNLVHYNN